MGRDERKDRVTEGGMDTWEIMGMDGQTKD